ncbi:hypothetical protein GOBAR_DD11607 [Gossypium barbadense]|nr:hypothetical protein GOBAR_DD11607 [Gossypium barbadense]
MDADSIEGFKLDKNATLEKMRDAAIEYSKRGQNAVVERKTVLVPKSETIIHAIVTNVKTFDYQLRNSDMKPIKEGLNGLKTTRKRETRL